MKTPKPTTCESISQYLTTFLHCHPQAPLFPLKIFKNRSHMYALLQSRRTLAALSDQAQVPLDCTPLIDGMAS